MCPLRVLHEGFWLENDLLFQRQGPEEASCTIPVDCWLDRVVTLVIDDSGDMY